MFKSLNRSCAGVLPRLCLGFAIMATACLGVCSSAVADDLPPSCKDENDTNCNRMVTLECRGEAAGIVIVVFLLSEGVDVDQYRSLYDAALGGLTGHDTSTLWGEECYYSYGGSEDSTYAQKSSSDSRGK